VNRLENTFYRAMHSLIVSGKLYRYRNKKKLEEG